MRLKWLSFSGWLSLVASFPLFAATSAEVMPHTISLVSAQQLSPSGEGSLDLSALKGRVAYVDFWASWCGPCRQSFPWLIDMQRRFAQQGLVVVAINVDKDRASALDFVNDFRPPFPIVYDSLGTLAQQFNIVGMPSSVIIDRDGKQRFVHTGFRADQQEALERELRSLL